MSDEQTIYIGPEDDLTSVRERLEHIESRRVIMVIPAQTQLRSHVAWKLLHARAREMGKDVLIISSDPQIRSVAQAVKFRVANSLEAAPIERSKPLQGGSRTGRTSSLNKGRSVGTRKAPAENRPVRKAPPERREPWNSRRPAKEASRPLPFSGAAFDESPFEIQEDPLPSYENKQREITPPIRPLTPEQIDEEPDLLIEDYHISQDIRQAAMSSQPGSTPVDEDEVLSAYPASPSTPASEDPFEYLDDTTFSQRNEQRAGVPMDIFPVEEDYPLEEAPTRIERPSRSAKQDISEAETIDIFPEAPVQRERPRKKEPMAPRQNRRSLPLTPREPLEEEEGVPLIEEEPPRAVPPRQHSRTSRALNRQPSITPRTARPEMERTDLSGALRPMTRKGRPTSRKLEPISRASSVRKQTRQRRRFPVLMFSIILLFILALGSLAFFVPAADITLLVNLRDYSHAVKLTAYPHDQQGPTGAIGVPADVLKNTFTGEGTGVATGSRKVDTNVATGSVTFTNNGTGYVTIPSGTLIETENGEKQYKTTAELTLSPQGSDVPSITVDVVAIKAGETGNTPARTVTVIPDESKAQIAKKSSMNVSDLRIQVINAAEIKGGGAGMAKAVTQADREKVTKKLQDELLNTTVKDWLQKQKTSEQDVIGKPAFTTTLVNAPKVDSVVNGDGSFRALVRVSVTVMVVRAKSLQDATMKALNVSLQAEKDQSLKGYTINEELAQDVDIKGLKTAGEGSNLALEFTAAGKAVPPIQQEDVQKLVSGKSVEEAQSLLQAKYRQYLQKTEVTIQPTFFPRISYFQPNIHVHLKPALVPLKPKP
ncbi:baseplate J/gp47 family protein [Thermosporothrix hazakensis]|jgi:hypothetical protein|nr:baseplate J/gp47 family protein [Thermosporothrix hazakensis]